MNFTNKLQIALFENVLVELASFSLPKIISIYDHSGNVVQVKYLDMRWEDYRNQYIKQWGQWTPFIAELPIVNKRQYLIWDGAVARILDFADIDHETFKNYYSAPKNWIEMAQGMDDNGNEVIRPKVIRGVEA